MRLAFFGSGYLGLVRICFADLGNEVICTDVDKEKIAAREVSWRRAFRHCLALITGRAGFMND